MSQETVPWRKMRHHWEIYLFILPTLVLIGLFQYYPAASGIFHSFYRWNGADVSEKIGWQNYTDLIKSTEFWESFRVVFILGAWNILKMLPALLVAVCIHRCRSERLQFLYRVLFVVPMVIPGLVVALIWRSFFFEATAGYLNEFLSATGLEHALRWMWPDIFVEGQRPAWLGDPRLILAACIMWGFPWVGSFAVLTHLAKLQNISKDVYEAGDIDGVNWWTKFTRIELPLIMESIYLMLVFVIIDTIKDAGMILALAGLEGGPGGRVTVPALFMIRRAFVDQQMGFACAIGIVLTIVVMALQKLSTLVVNWETLSPRWRAATRVQVAVLAVCLGTLYKSPLVGVIFFLVVFRWPEAWKAVAGTRLQGVRERLFGGGGKTPLPQRQPCRKPDRTTGKMKEFGLRLAKHSAIWFVLGMAFLPVYLMIIVSLKTNTQFYQAPAVPTPPYHWSNWQWAWDTVTPTVANTLFVSTLSTVLTLFFALAAAYFFARTRMPLAGFLWNAILLLMMMPAIANLVPLFRLLADMNLLNTLTALVIVGTSAGQMFAIFVLRSFVKDIPRDLFESAEIDGAGHFRQMMTVVLPLSGPILGTVGVMHFVSQWNEFILPLIVIRDQARLPVMVQLLRMAGEYIKLWGPMMAGYAIASIPIILLFIFSMRLFIKGMTEGAVKG